MIENLFTWNYTGKNFTQKNVFYNKIPLIFIPFNFSKYLVYS
ncbi:MAG: hypothetical protein JWM28_2916 [Chitinophagaceae bacterium]|nr:hypothetical protein [Chitinophagaceae bacterium]